ncbi:hypothetical protein [Streptomyces sp. NPDC017230]|uniref:hypothetical protein n=1 Tax=unclassified Streptomyces TaxID=2593676 RepID=UPI00379A418F
MRHNGRDPIKASTMRPEHLNLRDGEPPLAVCPDCDTWHRLTRSMIKPHRDGYGAPQASKRRYCGDKPAGGRRCPGSAQRIIIDITPDEWSEELLAADSTVSSRRSARQHHKPLPAPATPVAKMARALPHAADVLTAYGEHLKKCRQSSAPGHCGETRRCVTGFRLAAQYELLSRGQEQRDRMNKSEVRVDALLTQYRLAQATKSAAAEWAQYRDDTTDAKKTAKRSGTTIEETNNTCRLHPAGTRSEFRSPGVPQEPLRIGS